MPLNPPQYLNPNNSSLPHPAKPWIRIIGSFGFCSAAFNSTGPQNIIIINNIDNTPQKTFHHIPPLFQNAKFPVIFERIYFFSPIFENITSKSKFFLIEQLWIISILFTVPYLYYINGLWKIIDEVVFNEIWR